MPPGCSRRRQRPGPRPRRRSLRLRFPVRSYSHASVRFLWRRLGRSLHGGSRGSKPIRRRRRGGRARRRRRATSQLAPASLPLPLEARESTTGSGCALVGATVVRIAIAATVAIQLESTYRWCRWRTLIRWIVVWLPIAAAEAVEFVAARRWQRRTLIRTRVVGIPDALRADDLVTAARRRRRRRARGWRRR